MQEGIDAVQSPPGEAPYPVQFSVDYPDSRNRLSVLFRIILVAPILLLQELITGGLSTEYLSTEESESLWNSLLPIVGTLWFAPLLMIVTRRKYPLWCFESYLELYRFFGRILVYLLLLRDEYPALDDEQAVSLRIEPPDVENQLNRFLPIIKWLLAIPHLIILVILWIAALIVTVIAWFTILIVGRYPRKLFTFVEGTMRWTARVFSYAFMLATDRYPPFRFAP